MNHPITVATAGWSIPAASRADFPAAGTHLERYAHVLPGVEINSTFYRPHQPKTFERWAASTPAHFRFAVKIPKVITHERRLKDCRAPLLRFLGEIAHLGEKLGPLLVQLPPSLVFEAGIALPFLDLLRCEFAGGVALEPRHASWFSVKVERALKSRKIARVKADPAKPPGAAKSGGWDGLVYDRLHGSPRVYWSDYPAAYLERLSDELLAAGKSAADVWCVFDNTAQGFATANAVALKETIERGGRKR